MNSRTQFFLSEARP